MPNAFKVHEVGGVDVLRWESIDTPAPAAGEVLVRNEAIGLNFIDVYFRTGRYKAPLPFVPGNEGAGVIEALGAGVDGFAIGDRIAYADPMGSYAEMLVRPADRIVKLPATIPTDMAAAMMLKGLTAEYLLRRTYRVEASETILIHTAAGGVGQIACQWAKHLGATVIATVGSEAKRPIAEALGCDHVIVTDGSDFAAHVRELTGGQGVSVVYDGVGASTFDQSLRSLKTRGLLAAFGNASGAIPPFDIQTLSGLGSLYVTRPGIMSYTQTREELQASADALFAVIAEGGVTIAPPTRYALADAGRAHRDLESRATTGSVILVP